MWYLVWSCDVVVVVVEEEEEYGDWCFSLWSRKLEDFGYANKLVLMLLVFVSVLL